VVVFKQQKNIAKDDLLSVASLFGWPRDCSDITNLDEAAIYAP
jgi:hypothetical protein